MLAKVALGNFWSTSDSIRFFEKQQNTEWPISLTHCAQKYLLTVAENPLLNSNCTQVQKAKNTSWTVRPNKL